MAASTIPGNLVKLGLSGIRFPLSVAQQLGQRSGVDVGGFPPVAAFESVEAQAKQVLGRILHDEQLVSEGERQESAARHRRGARWLSTEAEEVRDGADAQLKQQVEQVEESRQETQRRVAQRRAVIRQEEEEANKEARARARSQEAAVRRAAKAREKAAEARERQAELARIQAESEAVDKEGRAVEAEKVVTAIDEHLKTRQAARRDNGN